MSAEPPQAGKAISRRFALALALGASLVFAGLVLVMASLNGRPDGGASSPPFRQITTAELTAMAPAQLAGLQRTGIRLQTAEGMNVPAIALDASYEAGPRKLHLTIVQSPGLDQVIGFGGAATTTHDRTSEDGYQRRWRKDGALLVESLDRRSGVITFGRVSNNFYVMARGEQGVSIEELRAAVAKVGEKALPGSKHGG